MEEDWKMSRMKRATAINTVSIILTWQQVKQKMPAKQAESSPALPLRQTSNNSAEQPKAPHQNYLPAGLPSVLLR